MLELTSISDSVSGNEIQSFQRIKKVASIATFQSLIDYLINFNGVEFLIVNPPRDIHKEALKIKVLYPILEVTVINNKIKISI